MLYGYTIVNILCEMILRHEAVVGVALHDEAVGGDEEVVGVLAVDICLSGVSVYRHMLHRHLLA